MRRDDVIVTTKVVYRRDDELRSATEVADAVLDRLDALDTDYLDVIQLHGVQPSDYTWRHATSCSRRSRSFATAGSYGRSD